MLISRRLGLGAMQPRYSCLGSISYYKSWGTLQAKLYVPAPLQDRRVVIIYGGNIYESSAVRMSKRKGYKVYLPRAIASGIAESRPTYAMIRINDGSIEILGFTWRCRVCGRPTAMPDGLCWSHKLSRRNACRRCGRPVINGRSLCDECLDKLESVMGLNVPKW